MKEQEEQSLSQKDTFTNIVFNEDITLEHSFKKKFNTKDVLRVDVDTSRLNNTIEYIGESLKYKEAQIDNIFDTVDEMQTKIRELTAQMSNANQFIAKLSNLNILEKLKELNSFDDLFERISMIKEINNKVEINVGRLDSVESNSINGISSIRMDLGLIFAKNEEYDLKFKGFEKYKNENKQSFDTTIEKVEERINNLKIRIEQDKSKNTPSEPAKKENVTNFLQGKLEDIFTSNRFKKLESLEPMLNEKLENLNLTLKEFVR